jgi:co-chaperonin GroES (HSP10)
MPSPIYGRVQGDVNPLSDHVLVINMEKGDTLTKGGLIITDDNGTNRGIRPRWAEVYKVGKNVGYCKPGDWILLEHGRWTFGVNIDLTDGSKLYIQRADTAAILLVTDECPLYRHGG